MAVASAQNSIEITGSYSPDYRYLEISEIAKMHLFVQEKGDVNFGMEPTGRFLKLSAEDAKRLGHEHIVVVHINEMEHLDLSLDEAFKDKPIKLCVIQLGEDDEMYYTKDAAYFLKNLRKDYPKSTIFQDVEKNLKDPIYEALIDTNFKDTLERSDFYGYGRQRYTKEFIDLLESDREVVLHGVGCAIYIDEKGNEGVDNFDTYDSVKLSKLAKDRLRKINHFIPNIFAPSKNTSKAEWQKWYQDKIENASEPEGNTALVPENIFSTPQQHTYNIALNVNSENGKMYQFKTGKIIDTENKTIENYSIQEPKPLIKSGLLGGWIQGKDAYLLGWKYKNENQEIDHDLLWGKFSVQGNTFVAKENYLNKSLTAKLKEKVLLDGYSDIKLVFASEEVIVVHFKARENKQQDDPEYYLITLETQTGKPIALEKINTILAKNNLQMVDAYYIDEAMIDSDNNFVFSARLKGTNGAYLLKVNTQLELESYATIAGIPDQIFEYNNQYVLTQIGGQYANVAVFDKDIKFQSAKHQYLGEQDLSNNEVSWTMLPDGRTVALAKNKQPLYDEVSLIVVDSKKEKNNVYSLKKVNRMANDSDEFIDIIGIKYIHEKLYAVWMLKQEMHTAVIDSNQINE